MARWNHSSAVRSGGISTRVSSAAIHRSKLRSMTAAISSSLSLKCQ
jgi:hypothetical protein